MKRLHLKIVSDKDFFYINRETPDIKFKLYNNEYNILKFNNDNNVLLLIGYECEGVLYFCTTLKLNNNDGNNHIILDNDSSHQALSYFHKINNKDFLEFKIKVSENYKTWFNWFMCKKKTNKILKKLILFVSCIFYYIRLVLNTLIF